MEHLRLGTVDSTSSEAQRELAKGRVAPFAVSSDVQTEGRGRQGRPWFGNTGNLYVSLVLPSPLPLSMPASDLSDVGTWPLRVASLISAWLVSETSTRPTVKWPNDLLFAGAKLGGILCETQIKNGTPSEVIVGVGINVASRPSESTELPAVCLAEISPSQKFDCAALANSLVAFVTKNWVSYRTTSLPVLMKEHYLEQGHLLVDPDTARIYRLDRVTESGSLLVDARLSQQPNTNSIEEVTSAARGFKWVYDATLRMKHPLAIVDVGNTATKAILHETAVGPASRHDIAVGRDELTGLVERLAARLPPGWPIFYLSVNSDGASAFEKLSTSLGHPPVRIAKRPLRAFGGYVTAEIGADRLAAVEGALYKYWKKGKAMVVASIGTAMTIDGVSSDGRHVGGWIVPGPKTALDVLGQKTSGLPSLTLGSGTPPSADLGTNTRDAMLNGLVASLLGTVAMAASYLGRSSEDVLTVVTGGYGYLLKGSVTVDPDLIFAGAREQVLGGTVLR